MLEAMMYKQDPTCTSSTQHNTSLAELTEHRADPVGTTGSVIPA